MVSGSGKRTDSRSSRHGRKKPPRSRLGLLAMLVTVAFLAGVIWVGSYLSLQPRIEALPSIVPFSQEEWMTFVPDSAQFVAYVNYQAAFAATGNYSLFGTEALIEIYSPPFAIYPSSVEYEVGINLAGESAKEASPSVNVIKMELSEVRNLESKLKSSTSVHRFSQGSHEVFTLLVRRKELQVQLVSASVSIVGQHLLIAQGKGTALTIGQILGAVDGVTKQFFAQSYAQAALFASTGSDNHYLALFVATFPTQIEGSKIAMKSVSANSGGIVSRIAFSFDNQDQARAQRESVRKLYTGGSDYWILGSFVVATFHTDLSKLADQIRGL